MINWLRVSEFGTVKSVCIFVRQKLDTKHPTNASDSTPLFSSLEVPISYCVLGALVCHDSVAAPRVTLPAAPVYDKLHV